MTPVLSIRDGLIMKILVASSPAEPERLRDGLNGRDVYSAVLLRHDQLQNAASEGVFCARMLPLHVDARPSPVDMVRVVDEVQAVIDDEVSEEDGVR